MENSNDIIEITGNPKVLILGNSPNVCNYELKDIVEQFYTVRFVSEGCNKNHPRSQKNFRIWNEKLTEISKYVGTKTDLYCVGKKWMLNRKIKYNNVVFEDILKYRASITKLFNFELSRGFAMILYFLKIYYYFDIKEPLLIHGFSFSTHSYFHNHKQQSYHYLENLKKLYSVMYDGITSRKVHNYILEKQIVDYLINKKKIMFLVDYVDKNNLKKNYKLCKDNLEEKKNNVVTNDKNVNMKIANGIAYSKINSESNENKEIKDLEMKIKDLEIKYKNSEKTHNFNFKLSEKEIDSILNNIVFTNRLRW